jgi:hypothetical protein
MQHFSPRGIGCAVPGPWRGVGWRSGFTKRASSPVVVLGNAVSYRIAVKNLGA